MFPSFDHIHSTNVLTESTFVAPTRLLHTYVQHYSKVKYVYLKLHNKAHEAYRMHSYNSTHPLIQSALNTICWSDVMTK